MRRITFIGIILLSLIGTFTIERGFAYVQQTIADYDGACSKLPGFPGVLQKVGLLRGPEGNCEVNVRSDGTECKIASQTCMNNGGQPGACTQRGRVCVCQVD